MTTFTESDHPRSAGKFTDKAQSAPEVTLAFGPSVITRGQSVGYSVGPSRMSREFVRVEDREAAAAQLAEDGMPGTSRASADYWMTQFDAYDIFEESAPAEYSADAKAGFDSVSLQALNLDLDHQPLSYNAFTVSKNEVLASNKEGVYRNHGDAARQARLNDFWDARAARLTSVREQLEALAAR